MMTDQTPENQKMYGDTQPQGEPINGNQQPGYQGQMNQEMPNYGQPTGGGGYLPQNLPDNYMTLSIVATVLGFLTCCTSCLISAILGIIAIVFSSQVSNKFIVGDYQGALSDAKTAKILSIVSLIITGVTFLGTIVYYAIMLSSVGFESFWQQYMETLESMQ